jgi:hypothetical protein
MVQVYKALCDSDSEFSAQWFTKMENGRATRQTDGPQLRDARAGHNYRRGFFSVRVVEHWNGLPRPVKEAGSIAEFKRRYRVHLSSRVVQREDRGPMKRPADKYRVPQRERTSSQGVYLARR